MGPSRVSLSALALALALAPLVVVSAARVPAPQPLDSRYVSAGGVFPALTVTADSSPAGLASPRSECGHGALMAWADKLFTISYLSVPNAGAGTGLYAIDANMVQTKLADHNSTFANRMLFPPTSSIVMGPWVIDAAGNISGVFSSLLHVRLGGMSKSINNPDTHVYMLGMDGPLWECSMLDFSCVQLFDLVTALDIPAPAEQPHFKALHVVNNTAFVASNTFSEADELGHAHGGRLASWDGKSANWTILARTAFFEVTSRFNMGQTVFALGQDERSVILKVIDYGDGPWDPSYDAAIQTFRLPKASHAYDHLWQAEWPRIREVETERYLMDVHGTFFELSPLTWGGAVWGVRPVSQHLRMIPDFASWRGFLVLGGNQVSSIFDANLITGQAQSGLLFTTTDALWAYGKPQGWGGVWWNDVVALSVSPSNGYGVSAPSDPYLMTGYTDKVAHVRFDDVNPDITVVYYLVEADFTGAAGHRANNGVLAEPWSPVAAIFVCCSVNGGCTSPLTNLPVAVPACPLAAGGFGRSAFYAFPPGFSAHWVRFTLYVAGTGGAVPPTLNATAWLTYT